LAWRKWRSLCLFSFIIVSFLIGNIVDGNRLTG
jgi:hypothetical protein